MVKEERNGQIVENGTEKNESEAILEAVAMVAGLLSSTLELEEPQPGNQAKKQKVSNGGWANSFTEDSDPQSIGATGTNDQAQVQQNKEIEADWTTSFFEEGIHTPEAPKLSVEEYLEYDAQLNQLLEGVKSIAMETEAIEEELEEEIRMSNEYLNKLIQIQNHSKSH